MKALPARNRPIVITDERCRDPVPQMKGSLINVASKRNGVGYGLWLDVDGWSDGARLHREVRGDRSE